MTLNDLIQFYEAHDNERDRSIVNAMFSLCRELGRPIGYSCVQEFIVHNFKSYSLKTTT